MTKLFTRRSALVAGSAAGATLLAAPTLLRADGHSAAPATFEVQMLNRDPDDAKLRNIFLPRIQVVNPGDTVNFVSTDKGHNSASADGMIPDGTEEWKGRIGGDIAITFDTPGVYGYVCTPHAALGMVGLVVVQGEGMFDNLEDAQGVRQRGRAKGAWEDIWEELAAMELTA